MALEYQIIAAFGLDFLVGDPRWFPHPVKVIGSLAQRLESPMRRLFRSEYIAGTVTAIIVIAVVVAASVGLLRLSRLAHPAAYNIVCVLMIYTTIAARDLTRHSKAVYSALDAGDLTQARKKVSMIVGRDTEALSEPEIARAAVESVAENTVDGVTAPLFYAAIAGPIGAVVYRSINTLDSMFGYKNDQYIRFGRFSAKIDDAVNYIPARVTAILMSLTAGLLRLRMLNAFKILFSDCRNHTSPNAGFPEAAAAGALGVQLGGMNYYFGSPSEKPVIGRPLEVLTREHIKKVNMLMFISSLLFIGVSVGLRCAVINLQQIWRAAQ